MIHEITESNGYPALIETFRWSPAGGYWLADLHLSRLAESAKVLGYSCDLEAVHTCLARAVTAADRELRVRLTLQADGELDVTAARHFATPSGTVWGLVLSPRRLDPADPLRRHKTTSRLLYDQERARLCRPGVDEILFANLRDEVCEGAITNVFLERGDTLLTPPLHCGLLPGVLRAHLLRSGKAEECILRLEDLAKGGVFVGNSVRGLVPARVVSL
jgi:4-amino-4-deoxychorismate lyase